MRLVIRVMWMMTKCLSERARRIQSSSASFIGSGPSLETNRLWEYAVSGMTGSFLPASKSVSDGSDNIEVETCAHMAHRVAKLHIQPTLNAAVERCAFVFVEKNHQQSTLYIPPARNLLQATMAWTRSGRCGKSGHGSQTHRRTEPVNACIAPNYPLKYRVSCPTPS